MKTYETWQVVKALTEHPEWRANAPCRMGLDWREMVAYGGKQSVRIASCGSSICLIPNRSDWRLYDEQGNEVTDYV